MRAVGATPDRVEEVARPAGLLCFSAHKGQARAKVAFPWSRDLLDQFPFLRRELDHVSYCGRAPPCAVPLVVFLLALHTGALFSFARD
ncbi:hypothetical protein ACOSP7_012976 [Xanthoceras sorbifolium]